MQFITEATTENGSKYKGLRELAWLPQAATEVPKEYLRGLNFMPRSPTRKGTHIISSCQKQ